MKSKTPGIDLTYGSDEWWFSQIKRGLTWRKKCSFETRWQDIRKYYEHRFKEGTRPNFNLIYMIGTSMIPAMVFQSPTVTNSYRRPEFSWWAKFFDGIDNWLIDEIGMKECIEKAILNAFLYNTAAFQVGYDFATISQEEIENGLMFKPIKGVIDSTRKTHQPWIDVIPPDRLILAPGTSDIRNCPWFAKLLIVPTRLLKQREGFKNVEITEVPEEVSKKFGNTWLEEAKEIDGYTSYYEIHDAEKKEIFCMDTKGKIIYNPIEDRLQVDGLPLRVLNFNRAVDSLWGTPDSIYIESQMLEGNECREHGRLQRRVALLKAFYDSELLSEDDLDKMLHGKPIAAIGVNLPPDKKLNDCIALIQPHVQMEYFQYQKELLNEAQLLTGMGPNQVGTYAPGHRTKYEAQVVEQSNLLRTGSRRQKVGEIVADLVEIMNQLVVKYWKAEVVTKVLGVDAGVYWVKAMPSEFKEITSQLVTKVNIESLTPISRERRKEEMLNVLQVLTKFQGVDPMPILQNFLSSFEWNTVTSNLPTMNQEPQGLPQFAAQQRQMMQSSQLGKQIQNNLGGMNRAIMTAPEGANQ